MLNVVTLPVVMALSWVPATKSEAPLRTPAQQTVSQPAQQVGTVTCPLTGEQIPSCCCPVKK